MPSLLLRSISVVVGILAVAIVSLIAFQRLARERTEGGEA
jgi:hypothetical protein